MNLEAHELWLAKRRAKEPLAGKAKDEGKRCARVGFAAKSAFEHNHDASVPAKGKRVLTPRERSRKGETSLYAPAKFTAPNHAMIAKTRANHANGFGAQASATQGKFGQRLAAGGILA